MSIWGCSVGPNHVNCMGCLPECWCLSNAVYLEGLHCTAYVCKLCNAFAGTRMATECSLFRGIAVASYDLIVKIV